MNKQYGKRGFTLVEMLVAVIIFLLFIGTVYSMYQAGYQSINRAEEQEDLYQTGRVLLAQLNAELASAYQSSEETASVLTGEDTEGTSEDIQEDKLTFLTTGHVVPAGQTAGELCQVTYMMGGGETADEPAGLYIEENFTPGLEPADFEPAQRLLSPRVISFNCKYLPVAGDWETEWVDQTTLPMAVRIELVLKPKRRDAKPLAMVSTINLAMATAPVGGGENAQP